MFKDRSIDYYDEFNLYNLKYGKIYNDKNKQSELLVNKDNNYNTINSKSKTNNNYNENTYNNASIKEESNNYTKYLTNLKDYLKTHPLKNNTLDNTSPTKITYITGKEENVYLRDIPEYDKNSIVINKQNLKNKINVYNLLKNNLFKSLKLNQVINNNKYTSYENSATPKKLNIQANNNKNINNNEKLFNTEEMLFNLENISVDNYEDNKVCYLSEEELENKVKNIEDLVEKNNAKMHITKDNLLFEKAKIKSILYNNKDNNYDDINPTKDLLGLTRGACSNCNLDCIGYNPLISSYIDNQISNPMSCINCGCGASIHSLIETSHKLLSVDILERIKINLSNEDLNFDTFIVVFSINNDNENTKENKNTLINLIQEGAFSIVNIKYEKLFTCNNLNHNYTLELRKNIENFYKIKGKQLYGDVVANTIHNNNTDNTLFKSFNNSLFLNKYNLNALENKNIFNDINFNNYLNTNYVYSLRSYNNLNTNFCMTYDNINYCNQLPLQLNGEDNNISNNKSIASYKASFNTLFFNNNKNTSNYFKSKLLNKNLIILCLNVKLSNSNSIKYFENFISNIYKFIPKCYDLSYYSLNKSSALLDVISLFNELFLVKKSLYIITEKVDYEYIRLMELTSNNSNNLINDIEEENRKKEITKNLAFNISNNYFNTTKNMNKWGFDYKNNTNSNFYHKDMQLVSSNINKKRTNTNSINNNIYYKNNNVNSSNHYINNFKNDIDNNKRTNLYSQNIFNKILSNIKDLFSIQSINIVEEKAFNSIYTITSILKNYNSDNYISNILTMLSKKHESLLLFNNDKNLRVTLMLTSNVGNSNVYSSYSNKSVSNGFNSNSVIDVLPIDIKDKIDVFQVKNLRDIDILSNVFFEDSQKYQRILIVIRPVLVKLKLQDLIIKKLLKINNFVILKEELVCLSKEQASFIFNFENIDEKFRDSYIDLMTESYSHVIVVSRFSAFYYLNSLCENNADGNILFNNNLIDKINLNNKNNNKSSNKNIILGSSCVFSTIGDLLDVDAVYAKVFKSEIDKINKQSLININYNNSNNIKTNKTSIIDNFNKSFNNKSNTDFNKQTSYKSNNINTCLANTTKDDSYKILSKKKEDLLNLMRVFNISLFKPFKDNNHFYQINYFFPELSNIEEAFILIKPQNEIIDNNNNNISDLNEFIKITLERMNFEIKNSFYLNNNLSEEEYCFFFDRYYQFIDSHDNYIKAKNLFTCSDNFSNSNINSNKYNVEIIKVVKPGGLLELNAIMCGNNFNILLDSYTNNDVKINDNINYSVFESKIKVLKENCYLFTSSYDIEKLYYKFYKNVSIIEGYKIMNINSNIDNILNYCLKLTLGESLNNNNFDNSNSLLSRYIKFYHFDDLNKISEEFKNILIKFLVKNLKAQNNNINININCSYNFELLYYKEIDYLLNSKLIFLTETNNLGFYEVRIPLITINNNINMLNLSLKRQYLYSDYDFYNQFKNKCNNSSVINESIELLAFFIYNDYTDNYNQNVYYNLFNEVKKFNFSNKTVVKFVLFLLDLILKEIDFKNYCCSILNDTEENNFTNLNKNISNKFNFEDVSNDHNLLDQYNELYDISSIIPNEEMQSNVSISNLIDLYSNLSIKINVMLSVLSNNQIKSKFILKNKEIINNNNNNNLNGTQSLDIQDIINTILESDIEDLLEENNKNNELNNKHKTSKENSNNNNNNNNNKNNKEYKMFNNISFKVFINFSQRLILKSKFESNKYFYKYSANNNLKISTEFYNYRIFPQQISMNIKRVFEVEGFTGIPFLEMVAQDVLKYRPPELDKTDIMDKIQCPMPAFLWGKKLGNLCFKIINKSINNNNNSNYDSNNNSRKDYLKENEQEDFKSFFIGPLLYINSKLEGLINIKNFIEYEKYLYVNIYHDFKTLSNDKFSNNLIDKFYNDKELNNLETMLFDILDSLAFKNSRISENIILCPFRITENSIRVSSKPSKIKQLDVLKESSLDKQNKIINNNDNDENKSSKYTFDNINKKHFSLNSLDPQHEHKFHKYFKKTSNNKEDDNYNNQFHDMLRKSVSIVDMTYQKTSKYKIYGSLLWQLKVNYKKINRYSEYLDLSDLINNDEYISCYNPSDNIEEEYDRMIDTIVNGFNSELDIDTGNDINNYNIFLIEYFLYGLSELKYTLNEIQHLNNELNQLNINNKKSNNNYSMTYINNNKIDYSNNQYTSSDDIVKKINKSIGNLKLNLE